MDDLNEKFIRCAQDVIGLMKAVDHSVVLLEKEFRRRFIGERFEYYEVEKVDEYKYTAGKFHRDMAGFKSSYELNLFLLESNLVPKGKVTDDKGEIIHQTYSEYAKNNWIIIQELVFYPILDLLEKYKSWDFSFDELFGVFNEYLQFHYLLDEISYFMITPIEGFVLDVDEFQFSDEIKIVKLSDDMKTHITTYGDRGGFIHSPIELRNISYAFYIERRKYKKVKQEDDFNLIVLLLVMSLRLATPANVFAKHSYNKPNKCRGILTSIGTWHEQTTRTSLKHSSNDVPLSKSDLNKAKEVFLKLFSLKGKKNGENIYNVVLKRFLSSLSKSTYEDSIIDYTICLESLVLANLKGELKFRLTLRAAYLVNDEFSPSHTRQVLSQMYNDRSDIVHEGKTLRQIKKYKGETGLNEQEQFHNYKEITKAIILKYIMLLSDGESLEDINDRLEREAFSGS